MKIVKDSKEFQERKLKKERELCERLKAKFEKRKQACGCCIMNMEGKILLGLRCKPGDKEEWGFVGGTVEEGETVLEGVMREIKEESGLSPFTLKLVDVIQDGLWDDHIYFTSQWAGNLVNQPEEIAEFMWVNPSELGQLRLYPATAKAIEILREKNFI